jgi:5'-nucleotidase / UDP-sugar diphosphatase
MSFIFRKLLISIILLLTATLGFASTVNILFFNDYHGQVIEKKDKFAGLVKFVSYIDNYKKNNKNTIIVAGGDNYQGSVVSNLTRGAVINKMFKLIGLTASAVGNHEFDWGLKFFPKWQTTGDFTYLAANVYNKVTGKPVSWAKPYKIVNINGFNVAFIGLSTLETPKTTLKENVKNLNFVSPSNAAQECIDYLNSKENPEGKPDYIIALTHIPSNQKGDKIIGEEIHKLIKNTKGLNAVFSAHSHEVVNGFIDNIPVIQSGSHGNYITEFKLTVNDDTQKVTDLKIKTLNVVNSNPSPLNKKAEEVAAFYTKKLDKLNKKVIGYSTSDISNNADKYHLTPMGATLCKAFQKLTESQVVIMNQWGIRNSLNKGKITYGELYSILPFDNTIITFELTGKDLKSQIEHSITLQGGAFYGIKADYDPSKPAGERLSNVTLDNGTPIQNGKYYKVAVNNFMYTGGDSYSFKNAKNIVDTQLNMRDLAEKYITQQKKITPVNTDYIKVLND